MAPTLPQNPTPANVIALLPKLNDADSDLRYMSLNDLYNVLNTGAPGFLLNDYHTCAKTVECLLKTLDDTHGEVQNQAITCLGALTLKINLEILAPLIDKLTNLKITNAVDDSIPSTALKTIILSFPQPIPGVPPPKLTEDGYTAISKVLIPRLVGYVVVSHGVKNQPDPPPSMLNVDGDNGASSDAIDVLVEVIRWFGPMLQDAEKQALQKEILRIFDNDRTSAVVKKKAVVAISNLAIYFSDRTLANFVSIATASFQDAHLTPAKRRLLITMLGSLARSIPQRLNPYLKALAPFVLSALNQEEYEQSLEEITEAGASNPEVDEVREAALVTLEVFLFSCSNEMRSFTDEFIAAAIRYVTYDPNHAIDEDDEEMGGTQDDDVSVDGGNDNDEDFEEEGALSEDDDSSWKVRRCAAKVLYTIISTRSNGDLLDNGLLYQKVAPVLIACFREREENVRIEVIMTLACLIRKTGQDVSLSSINGDRDLSHVSQSRKRRRGSSDVDSVDPLSVPNINSPMSGPRLDLARISPAIIREVSKLMKQSSVPTKQAAVTLLFNLVLVQHGGLSDNFGKIFDPVIDIIKPSSTHTGAYSSGAALGSKLRIDALQLISAICETHSPKSLSPYIGQIIPGIINAAQDRQYKVSSEAIYAVERIIKVLTPPRSINMEHQQRDYLVKLYETIISRALAMDADMEVRQRAIHALGVFLARTFGLNVLSAAQKISALNGLQDRLKNETTRLSAAQAIDMVCASAKEKGDLLPDWTQSVALELGSQLRKADRVLRGSSLAALKNLTTNSIVLVLLDDNTVSQLAAMLLPLLTPNDFNLLGLTLIIFAKLVTRSPKTVVNDQLNSALCLIVLSPLSGAIMENFLRLIKAIGEQGVGQKLMHSLLRNIGVNGDPAIVGKSIGVLLVSGISTVGVKLDDFATELKSSMDVQRKCLALSILGEAGLQLGPSSPLQPNLFTSHFNSKPDQVQRAAAIALGRAGAGNIDSYLPVILSTSNLPGGSQFLALHSIKEILQHASKAKTDLSPYTKQIWEKLLVASQGEDNKAVGAECIGRLAVIEPKTFLPLLENYLHDTAPAIRGMVIQAFRFTFADSDDSFDEVLRPMLIKILTTMLSDLNLENRRLALGALNSAIHNKPGNLLPHLSQLLPLVLKESKIKPELIREVQMGPFKHKVDDGLEVRKSAYETLYSLMESAYTRINPTDLFDRVVAGLEDEHEIKVLCNLMITKLIVLDPEETNRHLDSIAEFYRAILAYKPKDNAVKQDVEKAMEASKSVLKVTVLLHDAFPTASSSTSNLQARAWKSYWDWVGKEFRTQLQAMQMEVKNQVT